MGDCKISWYGKVNAYVNFESNTLKIAEIAALFQDTRTTIHGTPEVKILIFWWVFIAVYNRQYEPLIFYSDHLS